MTVAHMIKLHHPDFEITWKGSMYSLKTKMGVMLVPQTGYVLVKPEARKPVVLHIKCEGPPQPDTPIARLLHNSVSLCLRLYM